MTLSVEPCPVCGEQVVICDNDVWLDFPSVEQDERHDWTVMRVDAELPGGLSVKVDMGLEGEASLDGRGHTKHEHQPHPARN